MIEVSHLWPSLLVLALGLIAFTHVAPENVQARRIGALIVAVLMLRYLYWRVTETLPPLGFDGQSALALSFLVIELLSSFAGLMMLHVLSGYRSRSAEADANPVESHPGGPPLIDVLIPTYNESAEILRRTIIGAMAQDYPRFRVWVCDDLRRPWMRELAEELGANYLTRPDNKHGKAGNMNAALAKLYELPEPPDAIAVLDADFVATPHFLRRAAALLHDPTTAAVQTPQIFFNPDPIQLNLGGVDVIPDEQRFFFHVMMPAKDAHGTAFSCGTSCVIRVSALQAIGGFPTESVTEDLLLSIKFACIGMRTVYLNEELTAGLAPEGLGEYLTQRSRWCLGVMQIMRTRWSPLSRHPVPLIMRLHTIDTFLFWSVGTMMRIVCLVCPLLYWWFGVTVMQADVQSILEQLGPYWLACMLFVAWTSRGSNIPALAEAMSLLVVRDVLPAVAIGLFGRKDQKFKVTAKGMRRDREVVQWSLLSIFLTFAVLTIGGIAWRIWLGPESGTPPQVEMLNLFWSAFNLVVLALAGLVCIEPPRQRKEERFRCDEAATVILPDGALAVWLRDASLTGCALELPPEYFGEPGASLPVQIADVGRLQAVILRQEGHILHCAFGDDSAARDRLTRKLFSGRYLRVVTSMKASAFFATTFRRAFA